MLKDMWLQMKFGENFWVSWKLMHQKGEGDTILREMIILFSHHPIVRATSGYYKCQINIPMFNCVYLPDLPF